MLNEVISRTPSEWESASYHACQYHLLTVGPGDYEYQSVEREIANVNRSATKISRIQNPYMWGRYLLRKEQKQMRHEDVTEVRKFHPISAMDIKIVCEYNCDYRRYTSCNSACFTDSKTPRFYSTAKCAYDTFMDRNCYGNGCAIVLVNVLGHNSLLKPDSEYYPQYVVEF